jgi:penicillin-binding protein 2
MMRGTKLPARGRLLILQALIAIVVVVLIGRLWQLQMVAGEQYRLLSDRNRLREVDVAAPRGVIYDREGQILARNRPSFSVVIIPGDLPQDKEGDAEGAAAAVVVDRLLEILNRPVPVLTTAPQPTPNAGDIQIEAKTTATPSPKKKPSASPTPVLAIQERSAWVMPRDEINTKIIEGELGGAYRPVTVARYIQEGTAFLLAEDAVSLPGVQLVLEPIRDYPSGVLTSHIIGYMGHIPEDQLSAYEEKGYLQNEQVGLAALETSFEDELRGKPGRQTIEVDVNGRRVRTVGEFNPAQPGHNLVLSLDLDLQRAATDALQEALDTSQGFTKATQGVAIALDPRNGKILALVSLPGYDNNLFAKGITTEAWNALTSDPNLPLFNRAISGQYPAGSIFKILVASGGLEDGTITARTRLGDGFDGSNDGVIWLPNEYFPWDRSMAQPFVSWNARLGYGHGMITVRDALTVSDDIFFYELGGGYPDRFTGMGAKEIGNYARAFGLDALTGIDLPGEASGHVPDSKWKRHTYAENWLTGDTYNMSIGQGYLLATPLQMASATAAVANRGSLWKPQLVDHITDDKGNVVQPFQSKLLRTVPVNPANLDVVREGMFGAVNWPNGTATRVRVPGVTVAGKTGTAEFARDDNKDGQPDRDEKGNLPTHAWFTSFAPYNDPEIVVTVFVANGGEGSAVAAPVATKILQAYFEKNPPAQAQK